MEGRGINVLCNVKVLSGSIYTVRRVTNNILRGMWRVGLVKDVPSR